MRPKKIISAAVASLMLAPMCVNALADTANFTLYSDAAGKTGTVIEAVYEGSMLKETKILETKTFTDTDSTYTVANAKDGARYFLWDMTDEELTPLSDAVTAVADKSDEPLESEYDFTIATDTGAADIYIDNTGADYDGISLIASTFSGDTELVTGNAPEVKTATSAEGLTGAIIAGTVDDALIQSTGIDTTDIADKNEVYKIEIVDGNLVIAGSDKRGTIYGLFHISEEHMGVSPWVYWGDVTPERRDAVGYNAADKETSAEPSVKYRGIFLNDEAPNLTTWADNQFGEHFGPQFYDKVFELILRLKGNYMWPAMWSNDFYKEGDRGSKSGSMGACGETLDEFKERRGLPTTDDPDTDVNELKIANGTLADMYGIVMGTSHHEPFGRAGNEWEEERSGYLESYYPDTDFNGMTSTDTWNFSEYGDAITAFWSDGYDRMKDYEEVVTIGMRGEADSELEGTLQQNIDNLKNVITAQFGIMESAEAKPPTVLALYKEVEEFWLGEKDGVTTDDNLRKWALTGEGQNLMKDTLILLTNDNFGNVRTLPDPAENESENFGGWGMYYHFDYNGGPRSYRWVSSVQLEKIWQNMTDCYEYGVDDMWIVNVGDLKPHEMEISYFLDLAYDYDAWSGKNQTADYTERWTSRQFNQGTDETISAIAELQSDYLKLNATRRAEIVFPYTYNIEKSNELYNIIDRAQSIYDRAVALEEALPETMRDSYFNLVGYAAAGSANVTLMNAYSALAEMYSKSGSLLANTYSQLVEDCLAADEALTARYNSDNGGKWNGMQSNSGLAHIGATDWKLSSENGQLPKTYYVNPADEATLIVNVDGSKTGGKSGDTLTLPTFTSTNKEAYAVTVSNGGSGKLEYTAVADANWIKLDKTSGSIYSGDVIGVTVDWSNINETSSGTITVTAGDESVTVNVTAEVIDTTGISDGTFIGKDGVISIEAEHHTASDGMITVNNLGKNLSTIRTEDYTATYEPTDNYAPYASYTVYAPEGGTYTVTAITGPGNPRKTGDMLSYAIKVNDGEAVSQNSITDSFDAGNSGTTEWSNGVTQNAHISSQNVTLNEGENTIVFYPSNSAVALQKLVISKGENNPYVQRDGVKDTGDEFIGPAESYRFGDESVQQELVHPAIGDDVMTVPGVISEDGTVIVTETGTYEITPLDATGDFTLTLDGENVELEDSGSGAYMAELTRGKYEIAFTGADSLEFKLFNLVSGYAVNHPMSTQAEFDEVKKGYVDEDGLQTGVFSDGAMQTSGFKYDITSVVKYVLKQYPDAEFTLRMEIKADTSTLDSTENVTIGFADGDGTDIESSTITDALDSTKFVAVSCKDVDLSNKDKVYFYLKGCPEGTLVKNITVTYPAPQMKSLFSHTSAADWSDYTIYDSTNTAGTLTMQDTLTGKYTNSWNDNNGIKLNVTDYVKSCDGGKFGVTVNFTSYWWGDTDMKARLENSDGEVLAELASGQPDSGDNYTLTGEGEYSYSEADGEVYLCVTHPCGYHCYDDITFWGYETVTPTFPVEIFKHVFNANKDVEVGYYRPYETDGGEVAGAGGAALKYTNDTAETKGVKINVTNYIAAVTEANPDTELLFGASAEMKNEGGGTGELFFNVVSGTDTTKKALATSSAGYVSRTDPETGGDLGSNWFAETMKGETNLGYTDEDKVYLCVTGSGDTQFYDDVTLYASAKDGSEVVLPDNLDDIDPTPEKELPSGTIIDDTAGLSSVPDYYSTGLTDGTVIALDGGWLKLQQSGSSVDVTADSNAIIINLTEANPNETISDGDKLKIEFDYTNGNTTTATWLNAYLGNVNIGETGRIAGGNSYNEDGKFSQVVKVTSVEDGDLKLYLKPQSQARVWIKNVYITKTDEPITEDVINDTFTVSNDWSSEIGSYYSTGVENVSIGVNNGWLKVANSSLSGSADVATGVDAFTININTAATGKGINIEPGGTLNISFDFSNGNSNSLTGLDVFLGSADAEADESTETSTSVETIGESIEPFAGKGFDETRTFTATVDVTDANVSDLLLRLQLTGAAAKPGIKNIVVTYTEPALTTLFSGIGRSTWTFYDDTLVDNGDTIKIETYGNDSFGASYGNDWSSNNGVKLDVTDYLTNAQSGGKFEVTYSLKTYAWNGSDGNLNLPSVFFTDGNGTKLTELTLTTPLSTDTHNYDDTVDVKATGSLSFGDTDTVYLCLTHGAGVHAYSNIVLKGTAKQESATDENN